MVTSPVHGLSRNRHFKNDREDRWLPEVDGLRAFACLAVVFAHYTPWETVAKVVYQGALAPRWSGLLIIPIGSLGVELFFAISSFLLTYLAVREYRSTGSFSPKRFLIRRTLRIWPLYYTIVFVHIALAFLIKPHFPPPDTMLDPYGWFINEAWIYPIFLQNWINPTLAEIGILWSLGVEEQFYLLFPWVMVAIFSRRVAPITVVVALIVSNAVYIFSFAAGFTLATSGMYYATPTYFGIFAAGAWAGWIVGHDGRVWQVCRDILRRYSVPLGIAMIVTICVVGYKPGDRIHSPSWLSFPTFAALAMCYTGFILWLLANRDTAIARFFRSAKMRELGFLSFGIYMWHIVAKVLVFWRFQAIDMVRLGPDATFLLTFVYYVAGAVGFATLTYVGVERPVLRLKDRYFQHRRPGPTARVLEMPDRRIWPWYCLWSLGVIAAVEVVLFFALR
ncbi:MAG: acyltransferase family protein [Chloroflexota bacterium]